MATLKKIEEALNRASFCLQNAGVEQPRAEAEILLSHLMQIDRLQLFLNRTGEISLELDTVFQEYVYRRSCGEPLAYITGEKYFYGFRFFVNSNVLIPRPETELIIECAMRWAERQHRQNNHSITCIDLGTGSGILAVTLALMLPGAAIWAVDYSEAALQVAKLNAKDHNVDARINWYRGSYFDALRKIRPKPHFNLIISNPPYLSREDMAKLPKEVKEFEPVEALDGGEEGLDGYRLILDSLPDYIQTPGLMLFEIGAGQQKQVESLCAGTGLFSSITWCQDLAGHPRVLEGVLQQPEFKIITEE